MNRLLTPDEALSRIPGWDDAAVSISTVDGGLTNRNFLVTRGGQQYVLRLDAEHTHAFRLARTRELRILRMAFSAGLAPEPVYADADVLLCRYLPGRTMNRGDLRKEVNLLAIAGLLRKVHALPLCGDAFDAPGVASRYRRNLNGNSGLRAFADHCAAIVEKTGPATTVRCCHNDIVAANVVVTPELKLVDWEYACDNNPLFDLASLIGFHDLTETQARILLTAYAGDDRKWGDLQQQVSLYDAIQWLWLASRHAITHDELQIVRLEQLQQRLTRIPDDSL